jgi:hypothetical protein
MDISEVLKSVENTDLASYIRNSLYVFPMLESIHVVGLALVFGTVAVMDLRLLGLASMRRPFRKVTSDTLKWTWLAFAITFLSGGLMFTTNAAAYFHNSVFQAKMVILLLAGINMGIFELTTGRKADRWGTASSTPLSAKMAATVSLALWIAVIFLGRWIGFTIARSSKVVQPPPTINIDDIFGDSPSTPSPPSPAPPK